MNTHTHSTQVIADLPVDASAGDLPRSRANSPDGDAQAPVGGFYSNTLANMPEIPAFTTPAVEAAHAAYRQSHGVDALKAQRLHRAWVWAKAEAIAQDDTTQP